MALAQTQSRKTTDFVLRSIRAGDLVSIIRFESRVLGVESPDYWKWKFSALEATSFEWTRVAFNGGKLVGFLIAELRSREFRQPPTGWITELAVDPEYRRTGIGRRMLAEILESFREMGLRQVRTMVEWSDGELLSFFTVMGFDRGPFIELEKKL